MASFGQGLVILTGGIDLSIGAVMGIGRMIVANLTRGVDDALIYALPVALLCCTGIGVINGLGVAIGRLPPFIMTLSSSTAFFRRGACRHDGWQFATRASRRRCNASWPWEAGLAFRCLPHFYPHVRAVTAALFYKNRSAVGRQVYALGEQLARRRHPRLASGGADGHRLCAERLVRGRRGRAARGLLKVERDTSTWAMRC